MSSMILKSGREKALLRRHPWIFSGAVERVEGQPALGATVDVLSSDGEFMARAAYSPHSQIRARVWSFEDEAIDLDFFRKKIRSSIRAREIWKVQDETNAFRLIHAESDGLPGLIVDRYERILVLQSLTAGSEFWKETLADLLLEETGLQSMYERSDADVRELEGLAPVAGALRGKISDPRLVITEFGLKYWVDIAHGQKTGFYLDQRRNRYRVGQLAQGREVLNCFCYSGGFTIQALAGGATT